MQKLLQRKTKNQNENETKNEDKNEKSFLFYFSFSFSFSFLLLYLHFVFVFIFVFVFVFVFVFIFVFLFVFVFSFVFLLYFSYFFILLWHLYATIAVLCNECGRWTCLKVLKSVHERKESFVHMFTLFFSFPFIGWIRSQNYYTCKFLLTNWIRRLNTFGQFISVIICRLLI